MKKPPKKQVDEAWKEAVAKEKKVEEAIKAKEAKAAPPLPEMDFSLFISSLGMQALIGLGEITNPITKKKELDLSQAKQTIDILGILKEKTKGNLTEDEDKVLDNLLYDLRMRYVEKAK